MSEIPPPTVPPSTPPPPGGGYTPLPPPPPPPSPGGASSDRTLMLVLSYCWLLSLIPLLTKKEDPEVQWHAKNGTALAVAITLVGIFWWIISWFFPTVAACFLSWIVCLVWVGWAVLSILGIVKALGGQRFRIPVLTDMAEKINV